MSGLIIRKELKEKFLRDLNPSERIFFLKKAKEAVVQKGYQAGEELFHYCYFLTVRERFRSIGPESVDGMLRFLLVEGTKEVEEAIKLYGARLEEKKTPAPDDKGSEFLEYFYEQQDMG